MKILQIVGTKKSGKTATMIDFITAAKEENLKVVCFKRAHEAVMDTPGTDSFRFAEAGADAVGLQTANEFLWHEKGSTDLSNLMENVIKSDVDLVLIEGFRTENYPRLNLVKADEERLEADFYGTIYPENYPDLMDLSTTEKRKDWFKKWLTN